MWTLQGGGVAGFRPQCGPGGHGQNCGLWLDCSPGGSWVSDFFFSFLFFLPCVLWDLSSPARD